MENNFLSPVLAPSKNDFHRQLDLYRQTMPFKQEYIGMNNPYDRTVIRNQLDYDRYLREKLFHDLCEKAAEEELQHRTLLLQANAARRVKKSVWSAVFIGFLILAIIVPASVTSSRNSGYKDGVTVGYEQGHSVGYEEGASSGESTGFAKGSDAGYKRGYSAGYSAGYKGRDLSSSSKSTAGLVLPNLKEDVVYITATGSKYHRSNCSYLANSKYETTLSSAKSSGYEPCSRCNPPK